jgi:autotransporter-associated beta strand protein
MKPRIRSIQIHRLSFIRLLVAASVLQAAPSAFAVDTDGTWTNDGSGLWSTPENWLPGDVADGSGFTADFNTIDITDDIIVGLDGDRTLTNLIFGDTEVATTPAGWLLDNNGDDTNNLILAGTTPTITVNPLGTGKAVGISSVIEGSDGLRKQGTGTLVLSAANTYSGGTTVVGTLVLTNSNAAGTGTIDFRGSNGNPILRLDGTGGNILLTNSLLNNGGNLVNVAGANKVTSNLSINSGTSNSYFTVDAGTLELAGNYGAGTTGRNAWFQGAGTGIYSGNLAFGNNNVRKAGTGTWILTGTNTYSGWTDVGVGTLRFAKQVSLYNNVAANWTAANLVVSSGATAAFNVGGADEFTSSDIQTITSLGTSTGGFKSGATIGLDTTNASGGTFTYGNAIDNPNGGTNTLGLLKLGTGTLKLSGSNSFTGNVGIGIGTLAITNSAALGTGSKSINLTSGGTMALDNTGTGENIELGSNLTFSNSFAGATIRNVAGDNSIASGLTISFNATNSFLRSDAGSLTIQGNIGMNGYPNARNLILQGAGNGSISGDVSDTSGNLSIAKQDAGTWTFSGTNSYGGATTVNGGTLLVSGTLANSAVTVNNTDSTISVTGAGALATSLTVNSGAHLAIAVANTAAAQPVRTVSGVVTLDSASVLDLTAAGTPAAGTYTLLNAGSLTTLPTTINKPTLAPGTTWTVTNPGDNSLVLTVTTASGFATWIGGFNPPLSDPNDRLPGADPDNDGISNLMEYVLYQGDPTVSSPAILPTAATPGSNLVFTFYRRNESTTDTTQTFQYGSDLSGWTDLAIPGGAGVVVTPDTPSSGIDKVEVTITRTGNPKLFGRLMVLKP